MNRIPPHYRMIKVPRVAAVATAAAALALGVMGIAQPTFAQGARPATAAAAGATRPTAAQPRPAQPTPVPTTAGVNPVVQPPAAQAQGLEVTVGESRVIDAAWPVKKVSVADPE